MEVDDLQWRPLKGTAERKRRRYARIFSQNNVLNTNFKTSMWICDLIKVWNYVLKSQISTSRLSK